MQSGALPQNQVGVPPYLIVIRYFSQNLEALATRLEAKLQKESHADHDLAAHFGYAGDEDLPGAVFQFTDIAIQLHEQF